MPKPRVGISTSPSRLDGLPADAVGRPYVEAVRHAGALPIVLPVQDPADAAELLRGVDALLLTGGGDIDPARYGAWRRLETEGVDERRDAFEVALVEAAAAAHIPVLGICRGMQLLNVAFGGTLFQHLPQLTDHEHRERQRYADVTHDVEIVPGTLLASVLGDARVGVNTLHHQAVAEVGSGFRAVATACDDGVIEAIESHSGTPMLGVQWHPELLCHLAPHPGLFAWLVAAATSAAQTTAPPPIITTSTSATKGRDYITTVGDSAPLSSPISPSISSGVG